MTALCRICTLQVEKLQAALFGGGSIAADVLQAAVAGRLLVLVVRLLADPTEKCRELAAGFLAAALQSLPQPAALWPVVVPALAERVGTPPVQEESEEVRLALAELVTGPLLERAGHPAPAGLLPALCATVCCQLQDTFAEVKKVFLHDSNLSRRNTTKPLMHTFMLPCRQPALPSSA